MNPNSAPPPTVYAGPSAATAMRGARGAWDFLFVLLLLLLVQTGGRALRVLGPRLPPPPPAQPVPVRVRIPWGGWGEPAAGAFQPREDSGRPRDSTAPCPAHLRREPSLAGGGGAELRVFQEGGRRGA